MRLSKIKLAGFKSFVDPTTIPLPSNLIGIVGPNGCGKSNVIDAVRWVMGETSAKHLRGDSMADVIFNGSTSRKPVGQASIELIFDNADGRAGGQYAQYNEISVKRTVSRDGQSNYFLNGTRCRRRDITDLFLGTGLGPRSYAIIEQGTISRIIEAKPEELRIFLEEAAGISKYKERRRETENRMRHTRENLARLDDLRDELGKQIDRLQRQARTAERYKELKQEERLLKAQLQALRWHTLDAQLKELEAGISERETAYEAGLARQRSVEAEIERQREAHVDASEKLNEVQSRFYGLGADIARLEQSIQHTRERRHQHQQDYDQLEQSLREAEQHLGTDRDKLEQLEAAQADAEPRRAEAEAAERQAAAALEEAERAMHDWQGEWAAFNQRAAEPARSAEVERTRIQHLDQQNLQLEQRLRRVEDEHQTQSPEALEAELAELGERLALAEAEIGEHQARLSDHQQRIGEQREGNHALSTRLDEARSGLQRLRGRHASLEALQQAALGKQEGAVLGWLEQQGLAGASRLAQRIEVERGWERAVECVLGPHLQAVCVEGIDPVAAALSELEKGGLSLFELGGAAASGETASATLLSKVKGPGRLDSLLQGVRTADSLEAALAMRAGLQAQESVITPDGLWLGPGWLRVVRDVDHQAGVLEREQEIRELDAEMARVGAEVEELEGRLDAGRERLRELESEREESQAAVNQANRAQAALQADQSAKRARLEQMRSRQERLRQEIEEARAQLEKNNAELAKARGRLQEALDAMEAHTQERETLERQREEYRAALEQAREAARREREAAQEVRLRAETLRTELASTRQALERVNSQLGQLRQRREQLSEALAEGEEPLERMGYELEGMLAKRMQVEAELGEARRIMEDIDHRLRELEAERTQAEAAVLEIRGQLEQGRVGSQELKVRTQTLTEQVIEAGFDLQALIAELPEAANEEEWARRVEDAGQKIQRLGPINLAAIDEYQEQSERKTYLDAQHADLSDALETLEDAIRKIDRETRTRFKETYDKVNAGVQHMFPRLFGGGHAYLDLTGEDLLETGVTVMARPPGKRNSTIHLLSGGEKALTAVALVFAIFELNPAPFCMLDEVDAPLDEANVGRFCDLVKEMSGRTQFIFITHNKATMEVAYQLTGVTMNEPGVSRLVAVDVDEAAELAAM